MVPQPLQKWAVEMCDGVTRVYEAHKLAMGKQGALHFWMRYKDFDTLSRVIAPGAWISVAPAEELRGYEPALD